MERKTPAAYLSPSRGGRSPNFKTVEEGYKTSDGVGDPEMHQTKKGNQWYFSPHN